MPKLGQCMGFAESYETPPHAEMEGSSQANVGSRKSSHQLSRVLGAHNISTLVLCNKLEHSASRMNTSNIGGLNHAVIRLKERQRAQGQLGFPKTDL